MGGGSRRFAGLLCAIVASSALTVATVTVAPTVACADVTTNSNNDLRNGWYPNEPGLTPATVAGGTFGQVFNATVGGAVYAQPIVSQGTMLVATEDDNVYGLDPNTGAQKWQRTVGTPFNPSDIACGDLVPHVGITGTPVVDPATNIAYFVDKEYVTGTSGPAQFMAHAIDVATGAEQPGWPVMIQGVADGMTATDPHHVFQPTTQFQRPGLLLMDGVAYVAFGSSCDISPWTGWIVGLSTTQHAITAMFETNSQDNGAGIWQAGSGLMSDRDGQIVFTTGNAGFKLTGPVPGNQPPADLSEAVARVVVQPDGTLKPVDFFVPYDAPAFDKNDLDFGSGGPVGLPDSFGAGTSHPHLLVAQGKQGLVYLLDRNNLGGYQQGTGGGDKVVSVAGPDGGVWSRPAVWPGDGGYVYEVTANGAGGAQPAGTGFLHAYQYGVNGSGDPTLTLKGSSDQSFGFGSGGPVVTSNGTASGSALLWVVWMANGSGTNAQLRAYDPVPTAGAFHLVFSAPIGTGSKFEIPAVDNGHVYVGTRATATCARSGRR